MEKFNPTPKTQHAMFCGRTSTIHCSVPLSFVVYLQIKGDDRNSPCLHFPLCIPDILAFLAVVQVSIAPKTTHETFMDLLSRGCHLAV